MLTDIFGAHGNIASCQMTVNMPFSSEPTSDSRFDELHLVDPRLTPCADQVTTNTFAYVEFTHQSSAIAAVSAQVSDYSIAMLE